MARRALIDLVSQARCEAATPGHRLPDMFSSTIAARLQLTADSNLLQLDVGFGS
jgi:hypothetical protein